MSAVPLSQKLVVLCMLARCQHPLTSEQIDVYMMENHWSDYMLVQQLKAELVEAGFVTVSDDAPYFYMITSDGTEALDLFIARYGEELRSDIVKFPHHGRGRDAACKPCKAHLMTSDPLAACILSGVDGPELAGKVLDTLNVPWYDLNTSDVAYVIKDRGMEKVI